MKSETLSLKIIMNKLHFLIKRAFIQFDPCNAKQHYRSFIRRKNRKSVKQSKIIIYQSKTFENTNPIDIKSVIIEYPKTSHNMSKTIRQVEKVASNSSLYSDTKNVKIF